MSITFLFQDRNFPNTLIEMKRLAEDSQRFRVEDVPPRLHEKERVAAAFRDIGKNNKKREKMISRAALEYILKLKIKKKF